MADHKAIGRAQPHKGFARSGSNAAHFDIDQQEALEADGSWRSSCEYMHNVHKLSHCQ